MTSISQQVWCSGMLRGMAKPTFRISIIGAGNLARALSALLPKRGFHIDEIITRKRSLDAALLARRSKARSATLKDARFGADVIWVAVSDSGIRSCAERIAGRHDWSGKVVLHASGALSSDELQPLRQCGASVASAHPMMTFVPGKRPRMEGLAWTVEGDRKAVGVARRLIRKLEGQAFEIKKKDKPLYHVFGAFLSPLLVVHLHAAAVTARAAGIPRRNLPIFMRPILQQTIENFFAHIGEKGGAAKAFSGPLIRGDTGTIERHLVALRSFPASAQLYRALVQAAVRSDLPVRNRGAIESLLVKSKKTS